MNKQTYDADDNLIAATYEKPVATISYGRKVGLPNYSDEEMNLFIQVPLDQIEDLALLEKQLLPNVAFLKAFVCDQLGISHEVSPTGVVQPAMPVDVPKAAAPYAGRVSNSAYKNPPSQPQAAGADKSDLWSQLAGAERDGEHWRLQDGRKVFDNTRDKKSDRHPDYKWSKTPGDDNPPALWLNDKSKPSWFVGPGAGISL